MVVKSRVSCHKRCDGYASMYVYVLTTRLNIRLLPVEFVVFRWRNKSKSRVVGPSCPAFSSLPSTSSSNTYFFHSFTVTPPPPFSRLRWRISDLGLWSPAPAPAHIPHRFIFFFHSFLMMITSFSRITDNIISEY